MEVLLRKDDCYYSRIDDTPRVSERLAPVIYGGCGPLGRDQVSFYEETGYLPTENLFSSEELGPFQETLGALCDRGSASRSPEVILDGFVPLHVA